MGAAQRKYFRNGAINNPEKQVEKVDDTAEYKRIFVLQHFTKCKKTCYTTVADRLTEQ